MTMRHGNLLFTERIVRRLNNLYVEGKVTLDSFVHVPTGFTVVRVTSRYRYMNRNARGGYDVRRMDGHHYNLYQTCVYWTDKLPSQKDTDKIMYSGRSGLSSVLYYLKKDNDMLRAKTTQHSTGSFVPDTN